MGNKHGGQKKRERKRAKTEDTGTRRGRYKRSASDSKTERARKDAYFHTVAKPNNAKKSDSTTDPRYFSDMKLWMSSPNNPFATEVNAGALAYVRGVHSVKNPDELFRDFESVRSEETGTVLSDDSLSQAELTEDKLRRMELARQGKVYVSSDGLGSFTTMDSIDEEDDVSRIKFSDVLDETNSSVFYRQDEVYAFCVKDPCEFIKKWGMSRARAGDWIIIRGGHDVYANTAAKFQEDYVAIPGAANKFIKRTPVRARLMSEPFILMSASKNEVRAGAAGRLYRSNG